MANGCKNCIDNKCSDVCITHGCQDNNCNCPTTKKCKISPDGEYCATHDCGSTDDMQCGKRDCPHCVVKFNELPSEENIVSAEKMKYINSVNNMRNAMGTLPSQSPKKTYSWKNSLDALYVKLVEFPSNPYKSIVAMCAATWGDNETGSTGKWDKLTPENRYRVVLSCLTGNTLPQALESVNFTFEVNGSPRHTFDQHARARLGTAFASIGTRDNNKLDADFLFYPDVSKRINTEPEYKKKVEEWIKMTKDLYEETISTGQGSWQSGRAFLPMSTNHSYVFTQNFLALKGQCARRLMACEESSIVALHIALRELVSRQFPLLSNYLRPACDGPKKCIYHEGPEGMTKYFSSLFKGCGRWPTKEEYSEFNVSCSSYEELEEHGYKMPGPNDWIKYTENDYEKLSWKDKALLDENFATKVSHEYKRLSREGKFWLDLQSSTIFERK